MNPVCIGESGNIILITGGIDAETNKANLKASLFSV